MTLLRPRAETPAAMATMVAMALMLVASGSVSVVAEEEGQAQNKIRVAVMDFANNSSWSYGGG